MQTPATLTQVLYILTTIQINCVPTIDTNYLDLGSSARKRHKSKKVEFSQTQDSILESIHTKGQQCEEIELKIEQLKRLVEENDISNIEETHLNGDTNIECLEQQFKSSNEQLFNATLEEKRIYKLLEEKQEQLSNLELESSYMKLDMKRFSTNNRKKLDPSNYQLMLIRENNRALDLNIAREKLTQKDESEKLKWQKKLVEVDSNLVKYLGVFTDLAKVTLLDSQIIREIMSSSENWTSTKSKNVEQQMLRLEERELVKRPMNDVQKIAQEIENWLNMFVIVQKKNETLDIETKVQESKVIDKSGGRKGSRRFSRKFSRKSTIHKADLSFKSKLKRV